MTYRIKHDHSTPPYEFKDLFPVRTLHTNYEPVLVSGGIPQWVIKRLPVGTHRNVRCENGQWYINGVAVYDTPYIKTGIRKLNAVAIAVRSTHSWI